MKAGMKLNGVLDSRLRGNDVSVAEIRLVTLALDLASQQGLHQAKQKIFSKKLSLENECQRTTTIGS